MYKVFTVNGEDYKLEFAIEASLYKECIQSITELIYRIDAGQNTRDIEQVLAGIGHSDNGGQLLLCRASGTSRRGSRRR